MDFILGWILCSDGFYADLSKAVTTTETAKVRQASKQLSKGKVGNGRDLESKITT